MNRLEEIRQRKLSFDEDGNEYLEKDDTFLLRAVEQLAKSPSLLRNLYTSMFLSEGRNENLPPQVQYWLQEIPKYLDGLDPDIRELVEDK